MVRKGKELFKKPAAEPAKTGPKRFIFKTNKWSRSPPSSPKKKSFIQLHKAIHSKDSDYGKKGEETGNYYLKMLPSSRAWNEPLKAAIEKVTLGETLRWQQELKMYLVRIHSEVQMALALTEFKIVCTDCIQDEVEDAADWDKPAPKITFSIVKEVKVGDETRSAVFAHGDTYRMKETLKDELEFKFERDLGMWTRFYQGEPPIFNETTFCSSSIHQVRLGARIRGVRRGRDPPTPDDVE